MAKFCIYCGKALEEGEVCSCRANAGAEKGVQLQKPQQSEGGSHPQDVNAGSRQSQPQQSVNDGYQQDQPGGNGYYQQSQPGGNGYYQQSQPGGNGYYQQSQPGGNGYYQQGQPGGNGYYQQGQPGGNGGYQQGRSPEMEWITRGRELMRSGSSAVGTEFIIAKCVLVILIMFLAVLKIKSSLGAWGSYIEVPYFKMTVMIIILTVGVDFLEAMLMHGITVAFGGVSNIRMMLSLIGVRALYHSIGVAIMGLVSLVSAKVALVAAVIFMMMSAYVEHHLYVSAVECSEDRKLYAFLVEKICLAVVCLILGYVFGDIITMVL